MHPLWSIYRLRMAFKSHHLLHRWLGGIAAAANIHHSLMLTCIIDTANARPRNLHYNVCNHQKLVDQTSGYRKHSATLGVTVSPDGRSLTVAWKDGHRSTFHVAWLRHNCWCDKCVSSSGQKLVGAGELFKGITVTKATVSGERLDVSWSSHAGGQEGHQGHFPLEWLRQKCYSASAREEMRRKGRPLITSSLPKLSVTEIMKDDKGLWEWLRYLNEYGLCLVTDIPTGLDEIEKVGKRISHIQKTLHGEEYDIMATEDPVNIAYSTLGLGFHMDMVYYHSPPGLQLLHCIRNDPCVKGGESTLLDAFPVLEEMRESHPNYFATLTRVPATFQVCCGRAEPTIITYQRTHITVDDAGRIIGMFWCPPSEGPLCVPEDEVEPYYEAHRCLTKMLNISRLKLMHRLQPGEALTFNNLRILHSRSSFELNGGVRHLHGIYINIDEFKSKYSVIASKLGTKEQHPIRHVFNECTF